MRRGLFTCLPVNGPGGLTGSPQRGPATCPPAATRCGASVRSPACRGLLCARLPVRSTLSRGAGGGDRGGPGGREEETLVAAGALSEQSSSCEGRPVVTCLLLHFHNASHWSPVTWTCVPLDLDGPAWAAVSPAPLCLVRPACDTDSMAASLFLARDPKEH